MTSLQLRIIEAAVNIRLSNGENIDDILECYPKLSEEEKQTILNNI